MLPDADPLISTAPFMQLARKSPAIEVEVWFVIFHSKLPHDEGSGANEFDVQTTIGGRRQVSATLSRRDDVAGCFERARGGQ